MGIWVEGATETAAQISMVSSTQNSITVKVTAGSHGAPFGFDVVWRPVDQSYICAASFFCDYTNLRPGGSVEVVLPIAMPNGNCAFTSDFCLLPLPCDTAFEVRALIHQRRSSVPIVVTTGACS